MIPGSVKIYTRFNKLEPATRNNLDWFGFGYLETCDPRALLSQDAIMRCKDHQTR
jgi:hypothetical protein